MTCSRIKPFLFAAILEGLSSVAFPHPTFATDHRVVKRCSPKRAHPQSEPLLLDLSWLSLSPAADASVSASQKKRVLEKHHASEATFIGHNTYLADCAGMDLEKLSRRFTSVLQTGLSCLSQLGEYRKKDAAILLNFLDSRRSDPLVFRCAVPGPKQYLGVDRYMDETDGLLIGVASAFICTNDLFPGAIFSRHQIRRMQDDSNPEEAKTLFHEFVHLLGYLHMDDEFEFDVVRDIENCCFPPDEKTILLNPHQDAKNSCSRLRQLKRRI